MIDSSKIKAFDGDYEIVYSGDFNVYENKLKVSGILDLVFEFLFEKNTEKPNPHYEVKGEGKNITMKLYNFSQNFGAGTTNILPIATASDGRKFFFSIHTKSLSENTSFLKVSLTFYFK